jgi:hypothetical protein
MSGYGPQDRFAALQRLSGVEGRTDSFADTRKTALMTRSCHRRHATRRMSTGQAKYSLAKVSGAAAADCPLEPML